MISHERIHTIIYDVNANKVGRIIELFEKEEKQLNSKNSNLEKENNNLHEALFLAEQYLNKELQIGDKFYSYDKEGKSLAWKGYFIGKAKEKLKEQNNDK